MIHKANPNKMYYFSQRLKRQLAQIPNYPLTIVEAPSGFGKTTAIREYLKENLPPGAQEYWYTCLGESASIAWRGICELLANANGEIAANLKNLEMPTMDTLLHMTAILRDFSCHSETYLVVDNYQLVNSDIPRELMSVFSMHKCPNLHMIFITQQLRAKQRFSIHNLDINAIDSSAFFFDREGTLSLFRMEGIRLGDNELERVFRSTEGWVSAIRLQILNFKETGSFDLSADIEHLVESAIWKRLTEEEKQFLLSVSVLDSFTARQAAILMELKALPENIEDLLKTNDFIRYFPDKKSYTIHSILQDYLRNRFYHHQPEEFQRQIFRQAGLACAAESEYYLAAQFFYQVKDFDAILSMPMESTYLGKPKEIDLLDFIETVVIESPEATLVKNPIVLLKFAYLMMIDGKAETFGRLYRLLGTIAESSSASGSEDFMRFKGEYALLKAFAYFNDINKMREGMQTALDILNGPSSIICSGIPWSISSTSVLSWFLRKPGQLDENMKDFELCLPFYRSLTRGHYTGADSLMRAEALLMRGEDDESEILSHKALFEARGSQQINICLLAEMILAQIAILRGDVEGYFSAVTSISDCMKENTGETVLRMAELCLTAISLGLGIRENVAQWLYDVVSIKKVLYTHSMPSALMLYAKLLLMDKKYNAFFGVSQYLKDSTWGIAGNAQFLIPQINQYIFLAVAKQKCGNAFEAREYLKEALALALPDKIFLPFAQQEGALVPMLESLERFPVQTKLVLTPFPSDGEDIFGAPRAETIGPAFAGESGEGIAALKAYCKRYETGAGLIKKAIQQKKSPLTPREREIACLAKDRFSAKEIAERLYISDATVRTILRNVYSKLDIHSKTELAVREF